MDHLSLNEIIDFVSFEKLSDETLELAANVNSHLLLCKQCREAVRAYQAVYDEFCRLDSKEEFRNAVKNADSFKRLSTAEEIMKLVGNNGSDFSGLGAAQGAEGHTDRQR